ncbi:MAG: hypothetical protein PHI28_07945 [Mangrovibacterium sp.]|nr:hypothetical protein [Mangrovibacterium sp.]
MSRLFYTGPPEKKEYPDRNQPQSNLLIRSVVQVTSLLNPVNV